MWNDLHKSTKLLVKIPENYSYQERVAIFELDNVLIKKKFNSKFAVERTNWDFYHPSIPARLKELSKTFSIIILHDCEKIRTGKVNKVDIKNKLDDIIKIIDVPTLIYISYGHNYFSKPHTKIWDLIVKTFSTKNTKINNEQSFIISTSASRVETPANSEFGKQYADVDYIDRAFAANVGIKFGTPEVYFGIIEMPTRPWKFPELIYTEVEKKTILSKVDEFYSKAKFDFPRQCCVMIIGYPCSGKTSTAKYIASLMKNNPLIFTPTKNKKDIQKFSLALTDGRSIIVDDNCHKEEYREFIKNIIGEMDIPIIAYELLASFKLCRHLVHVRIETTDNPEISWSTDAPYRSYNKQYSQCKEFTCENILPYLIGIDQKAFFNTY